MEHVWEIWSMIGHSLCADKNGRQKKNSLKYYSSSWSSFGEVVERLNDSLNSWKRCPIINTCLKLGVSPENSIMRDLLHWFCSKLRTCRTALRIKLLSEGLNVSWSKGRGTVCGDGPGSPTLTSSYRVLQGFFRIRSIPPREIKATMKLCMSMRVLFCSRTEN